jgi:hypothetical protein
MAGASRKPFRVVGWKIDRKARDALLRRFPPAYPEVVADHVTLRSHVEAGAKLPEPVAAEIVGQADDGRGVQALVVRLDGTTNRPDGSTYHITWSLKRGRRPVESNELIRAVGWTPVEPAPVPLEPARWP